MRGGGWGATKREPGSGGGVGKRLKGREGLREYSYITNCNVYLSGRWETLCFRVWICGCVCITYV